MGNLAGAPGAERPRWTIDRGMFVLIVSVLALITIGLVSIPLLAWRTPTLAPVTTPEGIVQRFYAAAYRGDYRLAYSYLGTDAQRTLSVVDLQQQLNPDLQQSQVRVGAATISDTSATVRVTLTHFSSDGLFGSQEWSTEREVLLQREGDAWKIVGGAFYAKKIPS
jgi:hypothetical protein